MGAWYRAGPLARKKIINKALSNVTLGKFSIKPGPFSAIHFSQASCWAFNLGMEISLLSLLAQFPGALWKSTLGKCCSCLSGCPLCWLYSSALWRCLGAWRGLQCNRSEWVSERRERAQMLPPGRWQCHAEASSSFREGNLPFSLSPAYNLGDIESNHNKCGYLT